MALTAGLLTFLAVEALSEALELPGAPCRRARRRRPRAARCRDRLARADGGLALALDAAAGAARPLGGLALATLVAIGIGLHNLGEGLAIGTSFALGELALGTS